MSPNSLTTRVYLPHRLSEGLLVGPLSRFNGTPTAQEDSHAGVRGKDFCTDWDLHEYIAGLTRYFRLMRNLNAVMRPFYLSVFSMS